MGIITASLFISLDGVYQAPGGREEDREDDFEFGGWQAPLFDEGSGEAIGADLENLDALLLGRKTYDIFASYWPTAGDGPIAVKFNTVPKFVVSRSLSDPSWAGTTVLPDAASAGRLRERFDRVAVIGSGALVRSLLAEDVLDRLQLGLYPVAFGQGKRLFDADTVPSSFRLVEPARSFEKGAVSLVYERAGDVQTMDMPDEPQA